MEKDLAYITVKVTDKNGNLCPHDRRLIKFSVKRNGSYRASVNGDPTSLDLFHLPQMHVFNGMLTTIVQAGEAAGKLTLEAKAFWDKIGQVRSYNQVKRNMKNLAEGYSVVATFTS